MLFAKMFLSPSVINFLYHDQHIISQALDVRLLDMSLTKILKNGDLPKIQVVEKDGHWFALNNSQLELCRRLEAHGTCTRVKVDVVPITEVPVQLRNMMVVPPSTSQQKQKDKIPLTKTCSLPPHSSSSNSRSSGYSTSSSMSFLSSGSLVVNGCSKASTTLDTSSQAAQQLKQQQLLHNSRATHGSSSLSGHATTSQDMDKKSARKVPEVEGSISSAVATSGTFASKLSPATETRGQPLIFLHIYLS